MTSRSTECQKCGGKVEEGFLYGGGSRIAEWVAGKPEYSFFSIKFVDKVRRKPKTYRCTNCGYLEWYAN